MFRNRGFLNKGVLKYIGLFVLIIVLIGVIVTAIAYFSPEAQNKRAQQEYLQDLQEQYENDTYGGTTPEETLALFIEALEEGDIERASRYFLPEEQARFRSKLSGLSRSERNNLISDLKDRKLDSNKENSTRFLYERALSDRRISLNGKEVNIPDGKITNSINLIKNTKSGVWKIVDL